MGGFSDWLLQNVGDEGAVGDLARAASADPGWPERPDRLATYTAHLEESGASRGTLQNLTDAWILYASSRH